MEITTPIDRRAIVLFKDQRAGELVETHGGSRFTYAEGWRQDIACSLPAAKREHVWPIGLHPLFEHLGAEGWLREKQARAGFLPSQDDFGLLLLYGRDCIGAIGVVDPATHSLAPRQRPDDPITAAATEPGRTVSGRQEKLLAYQKDGLFLPAEPTSPATHIAKLASESLRGAIRNEALSLRLAQDVLGKDEVTEFTTGAVEGLGIQALIVTRFDRTPDGRKLRLEDFAQILLRPRGRDYMGKYHGSYEDTAQVVRDHSARPSIDLVRLFRQILFSLVIGNADAHLKNFSLLETRDGLRLSPAYDLMNTLQWGPEISNRSTALEIAGRKISLDELTRDEVLNLGGAFGLPRKAIDRIFSEFRSAFARNKLLGGPSSWEPGSFLDTYTTTVRNACARIFE